MHRRCVVHRWSVVCRDIPQKGCVGFAESFAGTLRSCLRCTVPPRPLGEDVCFFAVSRPNKAIPDRRQHFAQRPAWHALACQKQNCSNRWPSKFSGFNVIKSNQHEKASLMPRPDYPLSWNRHGTILMLVSRGELPAAAGHGLPREAHPCGWSRREATDHVFRPEWLRGSERLRSGQSTYHFGCFAAQNIERKGPQEIRFSRMQRETARLTGLMWASKCAIRSARDVMSSCPWLQPLGIRLLDPRIGGLDPV